MTTPSRLLNLRLETAGEILDLANAELDALGAAVSGRKRDDMVTAARKLYRRAEELAALARDFRDVEFEPEPASHEPAREEAAT